MKHGHKMPVIYRYLLSFVLILSVPIIMFGFMLQGRFMHILTGEIMQNNLNVLNKTVSYADWIYEQFEAIQHQIRLNRNVRPFFLFGNATSALDCVQELSVIKNANDVIFEIALYYKQDNHIYTGMGSFTPESFLQTQLHFDSSADAEFTALLNHIEEPVVLPAREALLNASYRDRVITFVYPIFYNDAKSPDATLVFFALEKDFFLSNDQDKDGKNEAAIVVLDAGEKTVMSAGMTSADSTHSFVSSAQTVDGSGTREIDVDGTLYLCSSVYSSLTGWNFHSFTPVSYAMMKTESLRREMTVYLLIIIALASIIIYWSMRLNYSPIKGLRDFAASLAGIDGNGNEIDTVQTAVCSLHDRNLRLIQSTSTASCDYILRNLLRGRYSHEEFIHLTSNFQLNFPHQSYVVLSVHIQIPASGEVSEKLKELLAESFICYLIEGAANSAAAAIIVNCGGGEGELLLDRLEDVHAAAARTYGCDISIGVGSLNSDIRDIPTSYMESLYALDYRFIKGNNCIIPVDEIESGDQVILNYPYHNLERLKYLLRLGDVCAIEPLLDSMLSYIKLNSVPLFIARRLCFDIIGIITKSMSDIDFPLRGEKSWIALISRFETIDELIGAVRNISLNICTAINENRTDNVPLIDKLRAYAKSNCFDPAFSIQEMADHFDMGVTHLSQYFKNKSGQTIIDFTTGLRMARARELLLTGDYKQSEIAKMTGYSSQTSFIRRFKQYFGQTPGRMAQKN